MAYLYIPPRDNNTNAVEFYINIMVEAFETSGEPVECIQCLDKVQRGDKVIVITVNDAARVILRKKGVKVYTWYQGIAPEEMAFNAKGFKKISQYIIWSLCDIVSLWGSRANLYVSAEMARHYKRKYFFFKKNYSIMPCFNQKLEPEAFIQTKYEQPKFIYSGSVAKWQCFNETLETFVNIKKVIPSAQLSIITNMVARAKEIISNYGIEGIEVREVPYKDLPAEMNKYKYGFLLRKKHIINKVATPTKMSTYIGCGVIPVMNPVIGDFDARLGQLKYLINAENTSDIIEKLKKIEASPIEAGEILKEYQGAFNDYYNRERYVKMICDLIRKYN